MVSMRSGLDNNSITVDTYLLIEILLLLALCLLALSRLRTLRVRARALGPRLGESYP